MKGRCRRSFYGFCELHGLAYQAIEFYSPNGTYRKNDGTPRDWAIENGEVTEVPCVFVVNGDKEKLEILKSLKCTEGCEETQKGCVLPAQGQSKKDGSHGQGRHK
jgi:hypothetical protein